MPCKNTALFEKFGLFGPSVRTWGRWNRETWQCGTISQEWTSRDLFQCSSRCSLQVYVCCRSIIWAAHL